MSLLQRYRKPGGLKELVKLIETSSDKARANILQAVENEDPDFAEQVLQSLLQLVHIPKYLHLQEVPLRLEQEPVLKHHTVSLLVVRIIWVLLHRLQVMVLEVFL